jgi:anti-sigma factor RsiW
MGGYAMNCDTAKSRIFPYVDGELPVELRDELDGHLAGCPSCRRCLEHELAFRDAYVAHLRPDPAPQRLRDSVDRLLGGLSAKRVSRPRTRYAPWVYALAAVVLLTVGLAVGMNVASMLQRRSMLAELTEASVDQHQKLVRGVLPPDIAGVSPQAAEEWFRQRLDFNVSLPALPQQNLTLVGGRISHLVNVEIAALEYRLDQKPVSLFVIPEEAYRRLGLAEKPTFKVFSHRGYDVIIWWHHGAGYTLVSEIGGRSCLVCHAPDTKFDGRLESLADL